MRAATAVALLCVLGLSLGAQGRAEAADPVWVNSRGQPYRWPGSAVRYHVDLGLLGVLDNAAARERIAAAFGTWRVETSAMREFIEGRQLPRDTTAEDARDLLKNCDDDLHPIILDSDGSITELIGGEGARNRTLGFGGFFCSKRVNAAELSDGGVVLNGRFIDGIEADDNAEITVDAFQKTIVHEVGHFLNLGHTQVGLAEALDDDPGNNTVVPIMFPVLTRRDPTLALDDLAAISRLYPTDRFRRSTGTITGSVYAPDGRFFQGAYVLARRADDPRLQVVGASSGARYDVHPNANPPPAELEGRYELPGLPPGSYTVEVEQIGRFYGVGPLSPPALLAAPGEFWNDADEANMNPPDDPLAATEIVVDAGETVENVDIVLNEPNPVPANDECGGAEAIEVLPFRAAVDTRSAAPDDVRCKGYGDLTGNVVWFRFEAARAVRLRVDTAGSSYLTEVAQVDACETMPRANIMCRAAHASALTISLEAGRTAYVAVADSDFSGGGSLQIAVDEITAVCAPDCNASNSVDVSDLILAVNILLGAADVDACPSADIDGDGHVAVSELIAGVNAALSGCE